MASEDKYSNLDPTKYKLSDASQFDLVKSKMTFLHAQNEWNTAESLSVLKELSSMYNKHVDSRSGTAVLLADTGFGELVVRMLTFFDNVGVFKDDATWFPTYYTYNICWNFTDASADLGKAIADAGIVKFLAANISHEPYLTNQQSKNVSYMIKASLSIIQNLCLVPNIGEHFEPQNMKALLQPFLTNTNEMFKVLATMSLTALINEEENKMMEDTGAINFIVKGLEFALKNEKSRRYRGFSTSEMTSCLSRMAANDANKKKIVNEGALPLLVKMLKSNIDEEHKAAGRTIWNISFDKSLTDKIREEPDLISMLQERATSSNKLVAKYASGALWVVDDKAETRAHEAHDEEVSKDHIFISYCWADQKGVIEIKDHLIMNGFRVWFDLEQMGGSTLEAMASGIENASVVLVCVSEKYKVSPNCRTEAEYTFQLKKPIVPVLMQRRYKADGWLGMLLGSKFYVNFDGKYPFAQAFEMLIKELNGRGKDRPQQEGGDVVDTPVIKQEVHQTAIAPTKSFTTTSVVPSGLLQATEWSQDKISAWRHEHGLTGNSYEAIIGGLDGKQLSQLAVMKETAPEFFFSYLSGKCQLGLPDMLTLSYALSQS